MKAIGDDKESLLLSFDGWHMLLIPALGKKRPEKLLEV